MNQTPTRVALVTGSNRGLGLAIVRGLAARGLHTVLTGRTEHAAATAAEPLITAGLPVTPHQLDVTDPASLHRCVADTVFTHGRLDVLVNNAAIAIDPGAAASTLDLERARATLETNLLGAWRCTTAVIPAMRANHYGRIVNLTTHMSLLPTMTSGSPSYRISKTALNALTRILADELHTDNILVNAVSPGQTDTRMTYGTTTRTPDHAAADLLWLALLPDDGPTGHLYAGHQQLPW